MAWQGGQNAKSAVAPTEPFGRYAAAQAMRLRADWSQGSCEHP